MKTTFIYELIDPKTSQSRYIGKSNNPIVRLKGHLEESKDRRSKITKKTSWIKSLLKEDLVPLLNIIDEVPLEEWEFWEQHYISLYRSWELKLVNGTDGGDGNMCWQKFHTEETKRKISLAHKGKEKTDLHRINLSKAKLGNKNAVGQKGSIRINKRLIQINKEKRVENIFDTGKDAFVTYLGKDIKDIGDFHLLCRSKGQNTRYGFFWIYEEDLKESYKVGDEVTEIELKTKNKEIFVYQNNKIIYYFNSIHDTATFFKTSDTTINNYLKSQKEYNGYLFKLKQISLKKLISYYDIIYTKEQLLTYSEEKLEEIVNEFYDLIKHQSFPYHETKENLEEVVNNIRNFNLESILKDGVFNNMTSSYGVSYLKSIFPNYYHCKYKKGETPIDIWNSERLLKKVIEYRVGLNKTRETFDLCLHQVIRGISARRSSISFFKPIVAASIYKYFLKDKVNPVVIDPCAGFGGRLLGFKSIYPEGKYIGIEPNKETYDNLVKLSKNFSNVELYNCKLEDYKGDRKCDLTFTSIPYYDYEDYNNEFNYKDFEEWRSTFIKSLLTFSNLVINLPQELQDMLDLSYTNKFYLKNNTSHFNKNNTEKKELILQLDV